MNRINTLFSRKDNNILSIYFTAGQPRLDDTNHIIKELIAAGTDMIEIGIPFSDPMADGPVIQQSSEAAIANGMTLSLLFRQLHVLPDRADTPLILMGYLNPVLRYGMTVFLDDCVATGIDGVIIPDLPPEVFRDQYQAMFDQQGIKMIFLVTPHTPVARIREIDQLSDAFIYLVTAPGTTGSNRTFSDGDRHYFSSVKALGLKNPLLAGFGIHDCKGFNDVCSYVNGAIIGSSFIRSISSPGAELGSSVPQFIQTIRS